MHIYEAETETRKQKEKDKQETNKPIKKQLPPKQ